MMNKTPIYSMEFFLQKTIFYYKQLNFIIYLIITFKDIHISRNCKTRPRGVPKISAEEIYTIFEKSLLFLNK